MKICPKCGTLNADDTIFCSECGTKIADINANQSVQNQQPTVQQPKKNNAFKVTAIILCVVLLLSSAVILIIGFGNSSETKGEDVRYIEDFPVIKNQTEFKVYDEEIFPAEEYEIKVERFFFGGAFKSISAKSEVFTDTSSEPVYNLHLDDGDYRVTLTDITKTSPETTSEKTTVKTTTEATSNKIKTHVTTVVIDITVNNEDKEAVDKIEVDSVPGKEPNPEKEENFIKATDADFDEFKDFLKVLSASYYGGAFDCKTSTIGETLNHFVDEVGNDMYEYYFGEAEEVEYDPDNLDPLSKWNFECGGYYIMPEENFKWIYENIFNVKYNPDDVTEENLGSLSDFLYSYNGEIYKLIPYIGKEGHELRMNSSKLVGDKYDVIVADYSDPGHTGKLELLNQYKFTAAIKIIDGKRYWSIYKIEEYDPSTEPSTEPSVEQPTELISADDVIDIYMKNKSVWSDIEDWGVGGSTAFFTFMDLDFDGIPELITGCWGGTGYYSLISYYKINSAGNGIEEIPYAETYDEEFYDFNLSDDYPKLYKDKTNGNYVYWCYDLIGAGRFGNTKYYGKLEYANGTIKQTKMFAESLVRDIENGNEKERTEYSLIDSNGYRDVSKSEYDAAMNSFMLNHQDINLRYELGNADDLKSASDAQKSGMLKSSLKAFGFDGYQSKVK